MRYDIENLAGSKVLAGALSGQALFRILLEKTASEPPSPEMLFLDFSNVEVATASFLRESVLALRDVIRGRRSSLYPVVANPNSSVRDELFELMKSRREALMSCVLDENEVTIDSTLIGDLDPKQRMTFDLVREHGDTDASELMRIYGAGERISTQTAWNNRLTALVALGLIVEVSQGRAKRYRPLFQGVS